MNHHLHQAAQPHLAALTTAETAIPKLRAAYQHSKTNHLPGTQTLKRVLALLGLGEHLARRALEELVAVDQATRAAAARRQADAALAELEDSHGPLTPGEQSAAGKLHLRRLVEARGGHRKPARRARKQVAA